jgi:hypothetical protein
MMKQNSIIPGSLGAIAKQSGKTIAETFVNADVIVLVDVSGSMGDHDSRGGRSRYDVACEELQQLQQNLPGKIAVVGFSDYPEFCPSGIPFMQNGGTSMDKALSFVKIADVPGMRFILISDGEPSNESETLRIAATFQNKIDVIFVGPEERPYGRNFLHKLAAATGGQAITVDRAKELNAGIMGLLGRGSV